MSERRVVQDWLKIEQSKPSNTRFELSEDNPLPENEEIARLLAHKPDGAAPFHQHNFDWFQHSLSESEFRSLHTVWEEERVIDAAKSIDNGSSWLSRDIVEQVREIASKLPEEEYPPLILFRRPKPNSGPFVADGNHRATGLALHMLTDGEYIPQTVYIGYPTFDRGLLRRLRGLYHSITGWA